jgi:hypothetical protein
VKPAGAFPRSSYASITCPSLSARCQRQARTGHGDPIALPLIALSFFPLPSCRIKNTYHSLFHFNLSSA